MSTATLFKEVTASDPLLDFTLIYGAAGAGKSRLATSLPERFGRIAYIAIDRGSENLGSVLPKYRDRIRRFKFDMDDPFVAAGAIALTDWKKEYDCDTLVIDTYTTLVWKQLLYGSRKGVFNKESKDLPRGVGVPNTKNYVVIPTQRDYGGVQGAVQAFLSMVEENQKAINVIFVCHETTTSQNVGGPRLAGKALTDWFPGMFTVTVHLDREDKKVRKEGGGFVTEARHIARVANHSHWIAGFKENDPRGCQLRSVELEPDPVNFWNDLDAVAQGLKEEK